MLSARGCFGTKPPSRRVVYTLLIINKAGGLVYNKTFNETLGKLSTNDYLVLAGTFHGVHAITRSLTPSAITSQLAQSLPASQQAAAAAAGDRSSSSSAPGAGAGPAASGGGAASSASITSPSKVAARASAAAGTVVDASGPSAAAAVRAQLGGIEVLESGLFRLTCFQTVSGTKFLLFTEPTQPNVDAIMKRVYELYADYVMKNPFYQLEMPIRAEIFDRHLNAFLRAK